MTHAHLVSSQHLDLVVPDLHEVSADDTGRQEADPVQVRHGTRPEVPHRVGGLARRFGDVNHNRKIDPGREPSALLRDVRSSLCMGHAVRLRV